jgi:RNA polymerase sigma-70 factor (ECF subfamily)
VSEAERLLAILRDARGAPEVGQELGPALVELTARARAAHPGVDVGAEAFVRHLAARLPDPISAAQLAGLHGEDLYLACACAGGNPAALAEFDRQFLGHDLDRALARITTAASVVEEVRQLLRVKLFVSDDGRARIVDYTGRGPLGAWLRVAAVRTALNLVTRQTPEGPASEEEPLLGVGDPETEYLKSQHRAEFEQAFRLALTTLSIEQRQLLRFHYVDGLTLAQIGRLRQVHESTISRRLLAARDQLLAETRRALSAELRLEQAEIDSLMGRVMSRADVTLSTLFRSLPG